MIYNEQASEKTPAIYFDGVKGFLEIEGNSRPEDAHAFYHPLIRKIETMAEEKTELIECFTANFKMGYFNSASAKFLFDMIMSLKKLKGRCKDLMINWYYEEGDIDMKESGEDFSEMVELPFHYIMVDPR